MHSNIIPYDCFYNNRKYNVLFLAKNFSHNFYMNWNIFQKYSKRNIQKYSESLNFFQNFSHKWILKYSEVSHPIIRKKYFLNKKIFFNFLDFITFYQKLYLQKILEILRYFIINIYEKFWEKTQIFWEMFQFV